MSRDATGTGGYADVPLDELRRRRRALKGLIGRRLGAIATARREMFDAEFKLRLVDLEIKDRDEARKANRAPRSSRPTPDRAEPEAGR